MTYFAEHLKLISGVTDTLNDLGKSGLLDATNDYYIHVELRETATHQKVGAWSDEIASDAWYFDPTDKEAPK